MVGCVVVQGPPGELHIYGVAFEALGSHPVSDVGHDVLEVCSGGVPVFGDGEYELGVVGIGDNVGMWL